MYVPAPFSRLVWLQKEKQHSVSAGSQTECVLSLPPWGTELGACTISFCPPHTQFFLSLLTNFSQIWELDFFKGMCFKISPLGEEANWNEYSGVLIKQGCNISSRIDCWSVGRLNSGTIACSVSSCFCEQLTWGWCGGSLGHERTKSTAVKRFRRISVRKETNP